MYHLPGRGGEAGAAGIVHDDEAESLGVCNAIGPSLQKLDFSVYPPENRAQAYVANGAICYLALEKDGRTAGEGETLNYTNEAGSAYDKEGALSVRNAYARSSGPFTRFSNRRHHPDKLGKRDGCDQDYCGD